jgi:hypothetical protein
VHWQRLRGRSPSVSKNLCLILQKTHPTLACVRYEVTRRENSVNNVYIKSFSIHFTCSLLVVMRVIFFHKCSQPSPCSLHLQHHDARNILNQASGQFLKSVFRLLHPLFNNSWYLRVVPSSTHESLFRMQIRGRRRDIIKGKGAKGKLNSLSLAQRTSQSK